MDHIVSEINAMLCYVMLFTSSTLTLLSGSEIF